MVTAPHVVEPILPGARDCYIDLGKFYDSARLEKRRTELHVLTSRYKSAYKTAYNFLAAADYLDKNLPHSASTNVINDAIGNCLSLLPAAADKTAGIRHCFIDTLCSKGYLSLLENFENWHIFNVSAADNDGDTILKKLCGVLHENEYGAFCAYSPLNPTMMRHLIIPCHRTIFTLDQIADCPCAAAVSRPKVSDIISTQHDKLLQCAQEMLTTAKYAHDALEEVYNPCVDFSGIHAEARKHIYTIL